MIKRNEILESNNIEQAEEIINSIDFWGGEEHNTAEINGYTIKEMTCFKVYGPNGELMKETELASTGTQDVYSQLVDVVIEILNKK